MASVFLSLGSNIDREQHLLAALDQLCAHFGVLMCSSVYESEAVGFDGAPFLNMVVGLHTDHSVGALAQLLRRIEEINGRDRQAARFSARTLDIDILTYDQCLGEVDGITLPREEILKHAFVLQPLAELAPDAVHPSTGQTYRNLWLAFDKTSQALWPVSFFWRGVNLSQQVKRPPSTLSI